MASGGVVVPVAAVAVGTLIGVVLGGMAIATGIPVVAVDVVVPWVRAVGSAAELSPLTSSSADFGGGFFALADCVAEDGCVASPPVGPLSSELGLEGDPAFVAFVGSLSGGGLEAPFAALASDGGGVSSGRRREWKGCDGGAASDAVLLPTRVSKRSLTGC
ncbi:MAG TPA: hypothetical protein VFK01_17345 [Bradyrhizobium sp.]|nr:hypothetical protein [Bradyrhizobium sp.]